MELLQLILDALKNVRESSIGEGNFGIVVDKFPSRVHIEVCAKYHKFEYNTREYTNLMTAWDLGLPVPKPLGEWPKYRVFAMKRVLGRTLEELRDYRFSTDVIEEVEGAINHFCLKMIHGDAAPRNIMLENVEIEDGIVVNGTAFIIDLGMAQLKPSATLRTVGEFEGVMGWLKRREARIAA